MKRRSVTLALQFTDHAHDGKKVLILECENISRIKEQFGCERIKTMGDAYMAVSGIPEPTPEHAQNIAKVAVLILRYWERRNSAHKISGSAGLASIQVP